MRELLLNTPNKEIIEWIKVNPFFIMELCLMVTLEEQLIRENKISLFVS